MTCRGRPLKNSLEFEHKMKHTRVWAGAPSGVEKEWSQCTFTSFLSGNKILRNRGDSTHAKYFFSLCHTVIVFLCMGIIFLYTTSPHPLSPLHPSASFFSDSAPTPNFRTGVTWERCYTNQKKVKIRSSNSLSNPASFARV